MVFASDCGILSLSPQARAASPRIVRRIARLAFAATLFWAAAPPASADSQSTLACPCTGFQPTDTPAVAAALDNAPLEIGVKFRGTQAGYITALRYYKGGLNTGTHIGHLWSSSGAMLAEATFTGETASGWQQVSLSPAVAITANTTYIASYHSTGSYGYTSAFFTAAVVNGPLRMLADGEDGANGVFAYGPVHFPSASFNSTNYWVDVVFNTSVPADAAAPTVVATSPAANEHGVPISSPITATFSEALAPASVSAASVILRTASLTTVSAAISYDALARAVRIVPSSPLANATTYSVLIKGGAVAPRITDVANNAFAADFTFAFTTTAAPPAGPNEGPGGPVLVVSNAANSFSRYPVELLRAEGLNLFAARDLSTVTATILNSYDVVVLGETPLTAAQVTMFTTWVNAGGTLIAMRPSKLLARLMGLTDAASTLSNQYLKVNNTGAGVGIVAETMQFHGTADLYTLSGATAIATLYSAASTSTPNPAVTTRTVGAYGGRAVAFTYDLAKSIVQTRQGNPAWAGQERDGQAPKRSDDMFYGNSLSDPQPDWNDFSKISIPQADEQQRLFANLILQSNLHRKPLPRFWYLPRGKKAVVVMTGDDHGDAGMVPRFDIYRQQAIANCSLPDWECVNATGYLYVGQGYTDAMANFYNRLGFETADHIWTACADFTAFSLDTALTNQFATFANAFPSVPVPTTNRTHCIAWSDWSTEAEVEAAHNVRLDTNYYYWPSAYVQNRPGLFNGTTLPMRFAKSDGTLVNCFQVTTQMTDESGQTYPKTIDSLLTRALDARGYYGVYCANMHFDQAQNPSSDAIVASAVARGVPVVSAKQMLAWLDGREGSSFGGVTWSGSTLTFSISTATGARNIQAMLPRQGNSGTLTTLSRNGVTVTTTTQTIKGMDYLFFNAEPGFYAANYATDTTAPAITAVTATPNSDGSATIAWTTNEAASTRVDYGTSSGSLTLRVNNPALLTSHSIKLTGLAGSTKYFYRASSADASLNTATSPNPPATASSFTTFANTQPVANAVALPQMGTSPLLVNFSGAASTDANNDSLTFAWSFGDGGSATGRVVQHTFSGVGTFGPILTVTDNRGGKDTASVVVVAAAPAFPQTPVLDNFNRADGPIGANWTDQTAQFVVSGNALAPTGSSPNAIQWSAATFGANQEAFVTLSAISAAAPEHNLMLKTQGSTHLTGHIEVSYNVAGSQVIVYTFTPPGTWNTVATLGGVTFAVGDRFGARAFADGTVQVFRNSALLGAVSATGWPYATLGGRIGVSHSGAASARFDNFGGGTVPAPGAVLAAPGAGTGGGPIGSIALSSAFPNPSNGGVSMALALPQAADVSVEVLDVLGRRVWSSPEQRFGAGRWSLHWDGYGTHGSAPAGLYLARIHAGDAVFTRRFAVVR